MALEMGKRPSELADIGCEFCAWCFDEALWVRERLRAKRQTDEAKEAQERQAATMQARDGRFRIVNPDLEAATR